MGALLHHLKDQNATATALRKAFPAVSDWQAEKLSRFLLQENGVACPLRIKAASLLVRQNLSSKK